MAAHTYRTWLWHQVGFATWNAQWYGGHHMAGYSLLYPPLAAVAGTRLVGVVAAVASVWLFAVLARRMAPTPGAGTLAAWLFLAGIMSNVVIGRMPFTLGVALAVGAWACARRSRVLAALLSLASVWTSPVAGVFLIVAAVAVLAGARARGDRAGQGVDWWTAAALGGPAVAGGLAMAALFPEGGSDHFVGTAFWPMLLVSLGALALVDPTRRTALWAAGLYVAVLVAAFALPQRARPELAASRARPGTRAAGAVRPPGRAAVRGGRGRRRAALPAVAAGRARGRRGARRPVDRQGLPRRGPALPGRAREAGRAARGAAHAQPLGGHLPRPGLSARPRLAPPARSQGQSALLRQGRTDRRPLRALAARQRRALGGAARGAARLLGAPGAPAARERTSRSSSSSTPPATGRSGR